MLNRFSTLAFIFGLVSMSAFAGSTAQIPSAPFDALSKADQAVVTQMMIGSDDDGNGDSAAGCAFHSKDAGPKASYSFCCESPDAHPFIPTCPMEKWDEVVGFDHPAGDSAVCKERRTHRATAKRYVLITCTAS